MEEMEFAEIDSEVVEAAGDKGYLGTETTTITSSCMKLVLILNKFISMPL